MLRYMSLFLFLLEYCNTIIDHGIARRGCTFIFLDVGVWVRSFSNGSSDRGTTKTLGTPV